MLHKEIAGLSVLFFILWILVASSGGERIQRVCAPFDWVGNIVLSASALASPDSQAYLSKTSEKVTYGCEYMVWRLFYQKGFEAWNAQRRASMGMPPEGAADLTRETPSAVDDEGSRQADSDASESGPAVSPTRRVIE